MREALARSDRDFLSSDEIGHEPSRLISTLTLVLRRPIEVAGSLTIAGFVAVILVNALSMQAGPHPAPFFGREGAARAQANAAARQSIQAPPARQPVAAAPAGEAAPPALPDTSA